MKQRDKETHRRKAKSEREARRKVLNKRKKCKHATRTSIGNGVTQCTECGAKIKNLAMGVFGVAIENYKGVYRRIDP